MAIPSSGVLTLSQIQTEFGGSNPIDLSEYYRGGSYVPNSTNNTSIPTSGAISISNFYNAQKSYTQAQIASYMDASLLDTFRWCMGGDTSYDVFIGGPYARYVSSSSFTANYSLSSASITGTTKFTVMVGITGQSPSFSSVTVNGTGVTVIGQTDYYPGNEMAHRILDCEGDFRNVTSVVTNWNRSAQNYGSWAGVMIVPGRWVNSGIGFLGSYALGANTLSFMTAGGGGDGALAWITGTSGMRYKQTDAWWYNNGGTGAFVNAGSSARTGSMGNCAVYLTALTSMTSTN